MVITADSKVHLLTLCECSIDSCVTDPPYELGFMGKGWDSTGIAYDVDMWKGVYRALKPGGYLLAFGGSRTYHRMACAIEDAGFEIRDQIMWVYGCLSDDTEILTEHGWEQYRIFTKRSTFAEQRILIYDIQNDIYKWEVPERWNEYSVNKDTAYRIQSDNTDQIVSRGHRCLVERNGELIFVQADELASMERMPTLSNDFFELQKTESKILLEPMQRILQGSGLGERGVEREFEFNTGKEERIIAEGGQEPCMEGRSDLLQAQGEICRPINKICEMPEGVYSDGTERRICNGTQIVGSNGVKQTSITNGMCASHKSRCNGQSLREPNTIQDECRPQTVRTRATYQTSLATVTEFEYTGIIFCPTVSTGAFVARRNGKIFITGNSGFPKSLNIGKAVDALGGQSLSWFIDYILKVADDKGISKKELTMLFPSKNGNPTGWLWNKQKTQGITVSQFNVIKDFLQLPFNNIEETQRDVIGIGKAGLTAGTIANFAGEKEFELTKGTSDWEGWGTALKPAHEPICVARKPLSEKTVAENVLKWGTGGINIDECRVETSEQISNHSRSSESAISKGRYGDSVAQETHQTNGQQFGRFPANFIHDGSEEVVALFPSNAGAAAPVKRGQDGKSQGIYGDFNQKGDDGESFYGDSGSAARFFYCAKTSKAERNAGLDGFEEKQQDSSRKEGNPGGDNPRNRGVNKTLNHHPTVKPIALMRYLCRLVTPKGGLVLDPFTGSGTTGISAKLEGFNFIGIEKESEYAEIAMARIEHWGKRTKSVQGVLELF